jgi:predicted HicB family RNase H-like nuclease
MKGTHLHIRITEELKAQAQELADKDGRTLTNWIEWIIKQEIEKAAK